MMAPLTLPQAGGARKENPFADLARAVQGGQAAPNPFADLAAQHESESNRHAAILARNEAGRARDLAESATPTLAEQIKGGARSALEAVKHPVETVQGMARSAAEDLLTTGRLMETSESQGTDQPSPVTPELLERGPRALVNTAANLLLPVAPVATAGIRPAINATLGAINDPEQPARGATAGLLVGEGVHRAPSVLPRRVRPPENRMPTASDASARSAFWQNLDQGAAEQTARGVTPVEGYEATARPQPVGVRAKRPPEGFAPGANPFADLAAQTERTAPTVERAPLAVDRPTDVPGQLADEHYQGIDARVEELNRQAALRALTGVRRRPGGVKPPAVIEEQQGTPAPPPPEPSSPPARPLEPAPAEPAPGRAALPDYPDGFTMGDAASRIPPDFRPPRMPRAEPVASPVEPPPVESPAAPPAMQLEPGETIGDYRPTPERLARAQEAEARGAPLLPEATPLGTPVARRGPLLNPRGFAEELQPGLAEAERALTDKGVTKTKLTFAEQRAEAQRARQALAADLGVSVLDVEPKTRMSGPEILRLKEKAGALMDQITGYDKLLADPATPAARKAGIAKFREAATGERDRLLEGVIRASSQTGRDLGFLRQVAQRTLDPDVWMLHAKKALGDRPLTDELVADLHRYVREAAEACAKGGSA
jgi:hypothetical protein